MPELTCTIAVPQTTQELDAAIQRYLFSDLRGTDLFCLWQAIRDVSLAQESDEIECDHVVVEPSY